MTITIEHQPTLETPDAGVIEEARARQHRHRRAAGAAATIVAASAAAILLAITGGGGGGGLGAGRAATQPAGQPAKTTRVEPSSCGGGRALQGKPSRSLLAILDVLRRSPTAADSSSTITARGIVRDVFTRYVRLTRTVADSSYYLYPAIVGGCGTGHSREGIMTLDTNIDLGHGLMGADGGGGASAARIEQGRDVSSGPPGSSTSETITMVVPDRVATVTLHYGPGPADGYTRKISPAFTLTTPVINNEVVVLLPRKVGLEGVAGVRMTWRATDGRIVKMFSRL